MNTQDLLKKYISEELIEDLSCFVEELFLIDADYLILMARKFFNLFFLFHKFNCEKYEKLGIPFKNDKLKIVSDRAIPVLENLLANPKTDVHKIVIGDDIIIHGRGIRILYDRIEKLNPNIDIVIKSFIINNDDKRAYADIIDKIHSCSEVSHDKWREVSNKIVASFLLSGRPYISYLPYFILDIKWEELLKKLDIKKAIFVKDSDMEYYGVDCFVYFGDELDYVRSLNCCDIAAVRFYNYKPAGIIISIPYFVTKALDSQAIQGLTNNLREKFFTTEYCNKTKANHGAQGMRPMELEYTMSLILARLLFDTVDVHVKEWPREIEKGTFSEQLLNVDDIKQLDIDGIVQAIKGKDATIKTRQSVQPPNEDELITEYTKIKQYYCNEYRNFVGKVDWLSKTEVQEICISEYIDKLLFENGNLDEIRCKNDKDDDKSRLLGMPISYILSDGVEFWSNFEKDNDVEIRKNRIFSDIIQAVDSGKGSIVIRTLTDSDGVEISQSLLHAGEQNYKYNEVRNYPFMYGLMLIEHILRNHNYRESDNKKIKEYQNYQELLNSYFDENNIYYRLDEQNALMKISVLNEYGLLLLSEYERYKENKVFAAAREYAVEIVRRIVNG